MYAPWHHRTSEHCKDQRPPRPPARPPPPLHAPFTTPHQLHAADATQTTHAPAPLRAGAPQSPRQERASKQAAQRYSSTTPRGHRDPGAPGATCREPVPSPTHTGEVGTRPEQPPGAAHGHMDPAPSPTGSPAPQPQTPPGASTHGHQPAASQAAATEAHLEPRRRHGTPDRLMEGPAYAPPEDPPTQASAAARADTTSTRPSDTVHCHAHNLTEGPNPQAPATSSTAAPGDLPATAQTKPASQRHYAPPAGLAVGPTEPSSPGRPAPNPDPGPDPAQTNVLADAPRSSGPGSRPGPPPVSEGHA